MTTSPHVPLPVALIRVRTEIRWVGRLGHDTHISPVLALVRTRSLSAKRISSPSIVRNCGWIDALDDVVTADPFSDGVVCPPSVAQLRPVEPGRSLVRIPFVSRCRRLIGGCNLPTIRARPRRCVGALCVSHHAKGAAVASEAPVSGRDVVTGSVLTREYTGDAAPGRRGCAVLSKRFAVTRE